jgi:hypothetical protein
MQGSLEGPCQFSHHYLQDLRKISRKGYFAWGKR